MIKLIHCLRRQPNISMEEFHGHWLQHHARLVVGDRPIRRYVQYHRLINDPIYEAMAQAEGATVEPYDGASVMWWDDHETMATDLADSQSFEDEKYFIDHDRSVACLVEERVVIEPNRPYPYVFVECLQRRDDVDRSTFHDKWKHHQAISHRAHAQGLLMGYIQNCAFAEDDALWDTLGSADPKSWDGIVTAYFESIPKLKALMASPLAAEESFEDERGFINHEKSAYLVATRHVIKDVVR